ncbi:hypothetical protein [Aquidulcibacter sp.]|jgi:hypothetical protein|uniref:hypothetical protein n=1 Tax=Aquidulcibacter sp. TaxID=2052990 RepID=UPI003783CDD5
MPSQVMEWLEQARKLTTRWQNWVLFILVWLVIEPIKDATANGTSLAFESFRLAFENVASSAFFRLSTIPLICWLFAWGVKDIIKANEAAIAADAAKRQRDMELPIMIEKRRVLANDLTSLRDYIDRLELAYTNEQARLIELTKAPCYDLYGRAFRLPDEAIQMAIGGIRFRSFIIDTFQPNAAKPPPELVRSESNERRLLFNPDHANNKEWLQVFDAKLNAFRTYIDLLIVTLRRETENAVNIDRAIEAKVMGHWL